MRGDEILKAKNFGECCIAVAILLGSGWIGYGLSNIITQEVNIAGQMDEHTAELKKGNKLLSEILLEIKCFKGENEE